MAKKITTALKYEYTRDKAGFALRAIVVLMALALLVVKRSIWTPDTLLVIVLIIGVVFGRARQFVIRFVPFLGMLIVYDSMRGWADDLAGPVHFMEMIDFDKLLAGGVLPTVWLQAHWWDGRVGVLEFYFYFIYTLHFLIPVIVGLILWKYSPRLYWPFVWTVVAVSFAAFVTYILFPAAPPWMAKELGYITAPLHRISSDVWWAMGVQNFSELYKNISPNAVAAVPSLHSAYPLIVALFIIRAFSFHRTWWVLFYPISMWVGVVYLGEHYMFDIVAAVVYVLAGMAVIYFIRRKKFAC